MIALTLARGQLARPTVRAIALAVLVAGTWAAWSPGTTFGLSGLLGGWQFASRHLLDVGLVLLAVAGALTGAAGPERRVDEQLHSAGVSRWTTLGATTAAGAWVAVALAVAFFVGNAAGGLLRSVTRGGSSWIDPAHALGPGDALLTVGRLGLAAALIGAVAALVGWVVGREDLGSAVVVLLGLPALEQASALLGRLPAIIDGWVFTPWGALRGVALADRGLSAPGWGRPSGVVVPAAVLLGWLALLVVLALPPSAGRGGSTVVGIGSASDAGRRAPPAHRVRPRALVVAVSVLVVVTTIGAAAVVPVRLSRSLPWRWQRTWRQATHDGWSSTQTVDRVVAGLRSDGDVGDRVTGADAVGSAVVDSLRRADRVDRQPESTIRGPELVTVRLHFDEPVVSGRAAFVDYLVRFALEADDAGHWHVVRAEGPVASASVDRRSGGGR